MSGKQNRGAVRLLASAVFPAIVLHNIYGHRRCVVSNVWDRFQMVPCLVLDFLHVIKHRNKDKCHRINTVYNKKYSVLTVDYWTRVNHSVPTVCHVVSFIFWVKD